MEKPRGNTNSDSAQNQSNRHFPSTRAEALSRLEEFLPSAERYGTQRNHVSSDVSEVSRLSSAVRYRCLLEEEIVDAVCARHSLGRAQKYVQEVLWRTYWKGWLQSRPQVWLDYQRRVAWLEKHAPENVLERTRAVISGQSGVAVMDYFANQLRTTGYLHNHARMWWASYWIHVERLPWELGAAFFFRNLLDADPASNTLGWRWVAGIQTLGKSYLVRRSNLEKYCAPEILANAKGIERLDDQRVSAVPFEPIPSPQIEPLKSHPTTPPPISGKVGVWIHADDCAVEFSPLRSLKPDAVASFTSKRVYEKMGLSALRCSHISSVLTDAVNRAGAVWNCPASCVDAESPALGVAQWACDNRLKTIVSYAPFIGPIGDALAAVRQTLDIHGVRLILLRREWDQSLFPLATAGFFPFWNRTQKFLTARSKAILR
ncbi:MAG: FAD-binding domain-containing protein [Verrucomicrobiota bacterium]